MTPNRDKTLLAEEAGMDSLEQRARELLAALIAFGDEDAFEEVVERGIAGELSYLGMWKAWLEAAVPAAIRNLSPEAIPEGGEGEGLCEFCGRDPYHYEDVGTAFPARAAVVCCDEAIEQSRRARLLASQPESTIKGIAHE